MTAKECVDLEIRLEEKKQILKEMIKVFKKYKDEIDKILGGE